MFLRYNPYYVIRMLARLKFLLQTPTLAGSVVGFIALSLWPLGVPYMDLLSWVVLTPVGLGGAAIALSVEVREDLEVWGWEGLLEALKHPSQQFLWGFLGHTPQALAGLFICLYWRLG